MAKMKNSLGFKIIVCLWIIISAACSGSPETRMAKHLQNAEEFYSRGQYKEAIIEYRNVLQIDANNAGARRKLALSYYSVQDFGNALQYLLKVRDENPDDLDIRLKAARCCFHFGKVEEGRRELNFILEKEPRRLDALLLLAELAKSPEEIADALGRLKEVDAGTGDNGEYNMALGLLYGKTGDLSKAENHLRKALKGEGNLPEVHLALGDVAVAKKDFMQAEQEFQAAAEPGPETSPAHLKLADFYLARKNSDQAKQVLENIIQKSPDFLPALHRLARNRARKPKLGRVRKISADRSSRRSPSDFEARTIHAQMLIARNETTRAEGELDEIVKALPDAAFPRFLLGLAYMKDGDAFRAKTSLQKAVDLEPNFTPAVLLLAEANVRTGAFRSATDSLLKVLEKDPGNIEAYILLAGGGQNFR